MKYKILITPHPNLSLDLLPVRRRFNPMIYFSVDEVWEGRAANYKVVWCTEHSKVLIDIIGFEPAQNLIRRIRIDSVANIQGAIYKTLYQHAVQANTAPADFPRP